MIHSTGAFFKLLFAHWNCTNVRTILILKIFHDQISANFPSNATELVKFLNYVWNYGFLMKNWKI